MHLYLNDYPSRLTRDAGMFSVKNDEGEQRFSPLTLTSICLTRACMVSTDALMLASKHNIPIVVVQPNGRPGVRMYVPGGKAIGKLILSQAQFVESKEGSDWFLDRLVSKTNGQLRLLKRLSKRSKKRKDQVQIQMENMKLHRERFAEFRGGFSEAQGEVVRGIEGKISQHYLIAVSSLLPKMYRFESRTRKPAKDRFNCALNYAYGVLYNQVHTALLLADLNLNVAVFHNMNRKSPAMSLDFIEPYRPWMDEVVIDLCRKRAILTEHTSPHKGGIWLNKTGRKIVVEAVEAYLEEKVRLRQKQLSRRDHILEEAQQLRRYFLKWTT